MPHDEPVPESPPAPPPALGPVPLDYQPPQPKSQWITDDQPAHRWITALMIALYPVGLVIGFIGTIFSMIRWMSGC